MANKTKEPLYLRIATGYFNRRPIEWLIDSLIKKIKTDKSGVVSVAYLDIDGFSRIEMDYGYDIADALLDVIVEKLPEVSELGIDRVSRYVRDSFLLVFDNVSLDDAFLSTELLRREISKLTFTASDETKTVDIKVSFSAGVASYPGDPEDRHELINYAEEAARRASTGGGNRTSLGHVENMVPKTSHYLPERLSRLRMLKERFNRSEASLLREALDDLLRKYDQRDARRRFPFEWEDEEGEKKRRG